MQQLDSTFLQQLVDQLSEALLHSIYLNASTEAQYLRLDACLLDALNEGTSQQFIQMLLSEAYFELPLDKTSTLPKATAALKQLSSIAFENQDYKEEHGQSAFGFGYPLVLFRDPQQNNRWLQAPLFIWNLELMATNKHWYIKRPLGSAIGINHTLIAFLQQRGHTIQAPQYDYLLNDGLLNKDELAQLCYHFVQQLVPNTSPQTLPLFRNSLDKPLQTIKTSADLQDFPLAQTSILWAGVFGLFRSHQTAILKDTLSLKEHWQQLQPVLYQERPPNHPQRSAFMKHSFPCMETDPCQLEILQALRKGKNVLVQAPPGTARSQHLAGVLYNIVSNAGTCLVVSDKYDALKNIQQAFNTTGLEELALLVEDAAQAPSAIVQSIWQRASLQQAPYQVSPSFIRLLKNCATHVEGLQGLFDKVQEPILGTETWTDVLGRLLTFQKEQTTIVLDEQLSTQGFQYTSQEFESILRILPTGETLFNELGQFQHPLNVLNYRFFETSNVVQMQQVATDAISKVLKVVQNAQRDAFAYLFEYEQLIEKHFNQVYTTKMNWAEDIVQSIQAGLSKSSYHFNKDKSLYQKLMKRVSEKYQEQEAEQLRLLEVFIQLQRYHSKYNYFTFDFLNPRKMDKLVFADLLQQVEEYKIQLYDWYDQRSPVVQKIVKDLAPQKIYPPISFQHQVQTIHNNLNTFEQDFAKSQVFRVDFNFVTPNIRKRLTQIEQLENNLKQLEASFKDFKVYHAFKFFWLTLSPQQQLVLEALTKVESSDWAATFSHWYLHALLAQHEDRFVPNQQRFDEYKGAFLQEYHHLQQQLEQHSLEYWRGKQTQVVQQFHKKNAPLTLGSLYNPLSKQHSLEYLVKTDPELFLSFYPVVLLSPSVAAKVLPLHPHLFDVVLVDQANQLPLREIFSVLTRGRYQLLVGDQQQLPTPEQLEPIQPQPWEARERLYTPIAPLQQLAALTSVQSLWEYAQLMPHYCSLSLRVHYRIQQQALLDFSNAAFYKNTLLSLAPPAHHATRPIIVQQVEGTMEQGENKMEWEALLTYLWERSWQGQKIGIAVATVAQRNAILHAFQQLPATQLQLLQELQKQGLFVKLWEQLQGESCDCLLVSTTQTAPLWAPSFAARLVNVLATRASQQTVIFTSIPRTAYERPAALFAHKNMQNVAWFYAYLNYAQAVSDQNEAARLALLELVEEQTALLDNLPFKKAQPQAPFLDHLLETVQTNFPTLTAVTSYHQAGLHVPLAILNAQQELLAVFYLDLYCHQKGEAAYSWLLFYEQYWQNRGIPCYHLWSINWWKNQQQALALFKTQLQQCLT